MIEGGYEFSERVGQPTVFSEMTIEIGIKSWRRGNAIRDGQF